MLAPLVLVVWVWVNMKGKVVVTGASGVLGTAVYSSFKNSGYHTLGLAHSRSTNELVKLDLLDKDAVERTFEEFKPDRECSFA